MVDPKNTIYAQQEDRIAALEAKLAYWQSQHDERTRQLGAVATKPAPKVTEVWPSAPEGWLVSPPKYHCYPIFVEMIGGEWHVCRHHDTAGVSSTVSKHETLSAALTAAQEGGE